jgi:hypothetical protein
MTPKQCLDVVRKNLKFDVTKTSTVFEEVQREVQRLQPGIRSV